MGRSRRDREIEKELRFHLESQVQENLRSGMTPSEARRQAVLAFGGAAQIHEECREVAALHGLKTVWADLRYAARSLRASPVFTATAVLSLALGIGANAAIFSLLHAALWKPLPVPRPAELYQLVRSDGAEEWSYSWPLYEELRAAAASYGGMFARGSAGPRRFSAGGGGPERIIGEAVSGDYFPVLEVKPSAGRLLGPEDDRDPQAAIVLSRSFWARRFHSDPAILGQIVQYDETPYRVIGVAQAGFGGIDAGIATDAWVPVKMADKQFVADGIASSWLSAVLRTKNRGAAQAAIAARFERHIAERELPRATAQRWLRSLKAQRIQFRAAAGGLASEGRPYERALMVLLAIVAMVLLISCANVANLLLARNVSRRHEIAVRIALGAGRTRLACQLLCESLTLGAAGTAVGLALGIAGCRVVVGLLPPSRVPPAFDFAPDPAVLAFAALLAGATTLLCGLGPVWRAWSAGAEGLHQDGLRVTERSFGRKLLVAGQLALSLVLLAGAGMFLKTLYRLAETDLGFRPERITTFEFSFPRGATKEHRAQVAGALVRGLEGHTGIAATFTSPGVYEHGGWSRTLGRIDGKDLPPGTDGEVQMLGVGPQFFEILSIPLLGGRTFDLRDDKSRSPVAVVNETFARRFFAGASPVGHVLDAGSRTAIPTEIVGVVRDVRHMGVKERAWPAVYLPALQLDGLEGMLLVRSPLTVAQATRLVREELEAADGSAQIAYAAPLETAVIALISRERLVAYLSAAFGGLAILLAAVGLYGVMAYNMSRRTGEIAIRIALGARPTDIRRLALGEALGLTAAGLLMGIPAALAAGGVVRRLLEGTSAADPLILGVTALLMAVVGTAAGWVPAARAARVDPNQSLKVG